MQSIRLAAVCAAVAISGGGISRALAPASGARLEADVRFANQLNGTHTWSVASNGKAIFTNTAPGTTSGYVAITDSTSTLTLQRDGGDSVFAKTNFLFLAGSYYTISATYGNGERPVLAVQRDTPPRDTMP